MRDWISVTDFQTSLFPCFCVFTGKVGLLVGSPDRAGFPSWELFREKRLQNDSAIDGMRNKLFIL
jgi:hypothetical protein